jgi:hypothetical protein
MSARIYRFPLWKVIDFKLHCTFGQGHGDLQLQSAEEHMLIMCHTWFSKENQVQTYMHARIKFHAYSDIKVYTKIVSRKKKKDYQGFML